MLIVKMRFGKQNPSTAKFGCMTYHSIGAIVKKSHEYCRRVCLMYAKDREIKSRRSEVFTKAKAMALENSPARRSKLRQLHYDWIIDEDTLKLQVGMSLDERAAAFKRHFPTKNLSSSRLLRIYRKYKIRFKKVKVTKVLNAR